LAPSSAILHYYSLPVQFGSVKQHNFILKMPKF
jgi:hypothetical protein